jgi:hypothetical protein
MAGLLVRVRLDWSAPEHFVAGVYRACRVCDDPTQMRDSSGQPCHQSCAEIEIARELIGRTGSQITDERVLTPAQLADERVPAPARKQQLEVAR